MRRDDYTVFCNKFKPNMNDNDEGLRLYHWEGEDKKELNKYPVDRIWTMVDCDGKIYIIPGWHFVNRMDYIITEVPWKEGQRDYRY